MVHETIEGTFRQTNLTNESPEYLAKREELRLAEIDLMRQRERVAELRRHLPPVRPWRTTNLSKVRLTWIRAIHPREPSA